MKQGKRQPERKAIRLAPMALLLPIGAALIPIGSPSRAVGSGADFGHSAKPILAAHCFKCHTEKTLMGGLNLGTEALVLKGGSTGPAIVVGNAAKSLLFKRVSERSMPPGDEKKLSDVEIRTIRAWIDSMSTAAHTVDPSAAILARGAGHWAFRPPVRAAIPTVKNRWWVRTPIDAFVMKQLEAKGLKPPPIADRRTLLRRLYLDLIGLPPTPEEQQRFLNDTSSHAYEKVVDDLLARPQYGEHWARYWLDLARYAESNGYERDSAKPSAWRYRDYVIDSFNHDKPYDRFLIEQIAGDEMPGANAETEIATSFLRLGTWDDEPAEPMVDRCDQLDDVLGTTAATFMAVTLRCARCHDHKFEPFTQRDYYRMLAVFSPLKRPVNDKTELDPLVGTDAELRVYHDGMAKADKAIAALQKQDGDLKSAIQQRLLTTKKTALPPDAAAAFLAAPDKRSDPQKQLVEKFKDALAKEVLAAASVDEKARLDGWEKQIAATNAARPKEPPHAYIWQEEGAKAPTTHLLLRGNPTTPGEEVTPGVPAILASHELPPPTPTAKSTGRRLWLAQWMARPDNPLTARVMVNRVWQRHFGVGLVSTESDFGIMGEHPTHPELLDWMTTEFVRNGWSIKKMQRLIVLSNVYKIAAVWNAKAAKVDPEGTLFWRWPQHRLEAEAIRDSVLAVSGQLNLQRGGPSIYPSLPQSVLDGQSRPGDGWGKSDERQASRRSIYIFVKRSLAVPELEVLDAPDTTSSCERRPISTVAPQALTFLNGDFIHRQASQFAARLQGEAGSDPTAQIREAYLLALCRPPLPAETRDALEFLTTQQRQIETDAKASGKAAGDGRQKALEAFCLVLMNTNEFAYN